MKKIVFLTGAGISAESGIKTFRDSDGLWENHNVMDVASIEGWKRNQPLVLDFYNQRRRQLKNVLPNAAHFFLAEMESVFEVTIITQNVDDLHERAGSTSVLHLHGELTKACDEYKQTVIDIGYKDIHIGDTINDTQSRPFIVWFGEAVPIFDYAVKIVQQADIVVVIGTSLQVYPAAGLVCYASSDIPIYLVDPNEIVLNKKNVVCIRTTATQAVEKLRNILLNKN